MTIVPPTELRPDNRRRSKRVKVRIPVVVRFQIGKKHSISENTHTLIVNDHGALILLAASVKINQIIRLENLASGEELLCRVTSLGPASWVRHRLRLSLLCRRPASGGSEFNSCGGLLGGSGHPQWLPSVNADGSVDAR